MKTENTAATRMALFGLKKQLATAERGHKLLKDKQDGLMQEFFQVIGRARELRDECEKAFATASGYFLHAQSLLPASFLKSTLRFPSQKIDLNIKTKTVMSVKIPVFGVETSGSPLQCGLVQTRGELDVALKIFFECFQKLIKLAEIEKSAENLAVEIEKTRRRVNALEHHLIPQIRQDLKFVRMKLAESERSAIVQLMAIKNMIEQKEAAKKLQKTSAK